MAICGSRPIQTRHGYHKTESASYQHVLSNFFSIMTRINLSGCEAVSPVEPQRRFGGAHCLDFKFLEYAKQPLSEREAANLLCSFDRSVGFYQTSLRHVTEDNTFHNHCCESVKLFCTALLIILQGVRKVWNQWEF
jgi:hypothetical protein